MGNSKKIPYLKEVLIYLTKYLIILFALRATFSYINLLEFMFLLILCLFLAFPIKIYYLPIFIINYFVFYYLGSFINSDLLLLFVYLLNTLINTFIIMIYIKFHVIKKETETPK